jgi:hypothetical protein
MSQGDVYRSCTQSSIHCKVTLEIYLYLHKICIHQQRNSTTTFCTWAVLVDKKERGYSPTTNHLAVGLTDCLGTGGGPKFRSIDWLVWLSNRQFTHMIVPCFSRVGGREPKKLSCFTTFSPSWECRDIQLAGWYGDRVRGIGTNVVFNFSLFKLASKPSKIILCSSTGIIQNFHMQIQRTILINMT